MTSKAFLGLGHLGEVATTEGLIGARKEVLCGLEFIPETLWWSGDKLGFLGPGPLG